jgi:4-hydroxy-tetrahydrodipicolinate reductase
MKGAPVGGPVNPPLAIVGLGRMGQAVDGLATSHGWPVRARIGRGQPITRGSLGGAVVAIEFTIGSAVAAHVRACVAAGCAVVVGTTGWYDALPGLRAEIEQSGGAMLWAPNFSVGALAMGVAAVAAARALRAAGPFDPHLVETHHAAKIDAPSGTARAVAGAVGEAMGCVVPVTSIRVGHVPGDHEMIFDGPFEQLRVQHVVRDRRVFADGALAAARWLAGRKGGGVFTMDDVLRDGADGDRDARGGRTT